MTMEMRRGTWLPIDIYKSVRPFIEELVEEMGRPVTYGELSDRLYEAMGPKRVISHAQIGGHIYRSKKLVRFKQGNLIYIASKESFNKFLAGR